ncbi:MAG: hypothetical protein ACRDLD_02390 [Thermoleophilaceae bacterium]
MSQEFTITSEHGRSEWVNPRHGPMVDYYLTLAGYGDRVVLTQKPDTPPPDVGDSIYGSITVYNLTTRDGKPFQKHKLSKEQRPDRPHRLDARGAVGQPELPVDSRGARIERQHSQEMALRTLDLLDGEITVQTIRVWTDFFVSDIDNAISPTSQSEAVEPQTETPGDAPPSVLEEAKQLPLEQVLLEAVASGSRDVSSLESAVAGVTDQRKFASALKRLAAERQPPLTDAFDEPPF